jgi:molybdopterin molybdotransferase
MISVAEALDRVINGVERVPAEQISISDALGRVLAADVVSRVTQPPADVSSMDGYAVRSQDVASPPTTLVRIGESAAGSAFAGQLGAGQTVRIFTGAPVPEGADAIVIQEDTDSDGGNVTMNVSAEVGACVRRAGLDFQTGQVLLPAGRVVTARDVGMAAAMNVPWLMVRRRPRVAIVATGDEVVMPGDPVGPSQILSSNSLALAATVTAFGGVPVNLGIARDDEESLLAMVMAARGADMLVTIGGASVGDHDLVRKVLGDEGFDLTFYRIAMRPGKPLIFGRLGETPVLGLPGNPVSVGVTSMLFLRPAMRVMLGMAAEDGPLPRAILGRDLGENDKREDYMRAALNQDGDGNLVATPFEKQDSSMLALFSEADCLVIRPPFAPPAAAGTWVSYLPLRLGMISI